MRFLRTATTGRLLAAIGAVVAAIIVGAAVAVAATSGGPAPKRQPLAAAVHQALKAPAVSGISARISFTNNLIDSAEIQGSDPLLKGGTGRLWMSSAKHELRLEVQGENGDAQVVVRNHSFWAYDPTSQTVYRGVLPAQSASSGTQPSKHHEGVPSVAQIESALNRITRHAQLSGAIPGDIAGRPAYTVRVSPKQSGGLLGAVELGWDAVRGVPLRFEVLARGDSTPVLELTATNVTFGSVSASAFSISPPRGAKVVQLSALSSSGTQRHRARSTDKRHQVAGVAAVSRALPFKLAAPSSVGGLHRNSVTLLHGGSHPAALVSYGQGLGGIAVLEQAATGSSRLAASSSGGGDGQGLSIPTVSINGSSGQELDTALGTVIRFTRDQVAYTVLGSVRPAVARAAARGL
jgi:outer membrane lipoprotein-sorting protein